MASPAAARPPGHGGLPARRPACKAAALALVVAADTLAVWAVALSLLGAGTALVCPTLLAAIGDEAHPAWRARAVGVYRLWREGGFSVGALPAGVLADAYGIRAAIRVTAASGLLAAVLMYETHPAGVRDDRRRPASMVE